MSNVALQARVRIRYKRDIGTSCNDALQAKKTLGYKRGTGASWNVGLQAGYWYVV